VYLDLSLIKYYVKSACRASIRIANCVEILGLRAPRTDLAARQVNVAAERAAGDETQGDDEPCESPKPRTQGSLAPGSVHLAATERPVYFTGFGRAVYGRRVRWHRASFQALEKVIWKEDELVRAGRWSCRRTAGTGRRSPRSSSSPSREIRFCTDLESLTCPIPFLDTLESPTN